MNDEDRDRWVDVLKEELIARRVVALVGAGVSAPAGVPDWGGLLSRMEEELQKKDRSTAHLFAELREKQLFASACELYKRSPLTYGEKQKLFNDLFLRDVAPTQLHHRLVRAQLRGIITTNYDHLIEDAYASFKGRILRPYTLDEVLDPTFQYPDDFFILKVHGDAANWSRIVAGDEASDAAWLPSVRNFLENRVLLVIGFNAKSYLLPQLILSLPNTDIRVIMAPGKSSECTKHLLSILEALPPRVVIGEASESDLKSLMGSDADEKNTIVERLVALEATLAEITNAAVRSPSFASTGSVCLSSRRLSTEYVGAWLLHEKQPWPGGQEKVEKALRTAVNVVTDLSKSSKFSDEQKVLLKKYAANELNRLTIVEALRGGVDHVRQVMEQVEEIMKAGQTSE